MLIIGICEDKEIERDKIRDMVSHILFSRTEFQVRLFSEGKELLQAVETKRFDCNLLLLDIHMPKPDGMELAHELRKRQTDTDIIFITESQEHVFEGYTCKAFTYILKPCTMQRLSEELNRYLDELENTSECLNVNIQGTTRRIPLSDIIFIESDRRKIILHTGNEQIVFYEKMEIIEQLLDGKGFLRCHQSYMVQKRLVTGFSRNGIEIQSIRVPVSRKYYDSIKSAF